MERFSDRLTSAIKRAGTPVCVGLDPVIDRLPAAAIAAAGSEGDDRERCARACEWFCLRIIDAVADLVPCVKPQVAFFERYGAAGIGALERIVSHARERGLIVIADAKRSDIGNTARAYADRFLGAVPGLDGPIEGLGADAITLSPYLGPESLGPFVDVCQERGRGMFVLVRTSNPGADWVQDVPTLDGTTVAGHVAGVVRELGRELVGSSGYSDVGAVVAGNRPDQGAWLRTLLPGVILLVPGYGAQGGTAADIAALADDRAGGIVVNASRSLIFAYDRYGEPFDVACRQATIKMIEEVRAALGC